MIEDEQLTERKRELRGSTTAVRKAQDNKVELSRRITERIVCLSPFQAAQTVAVYVSTAVEVQTREFIERCWRENKPVAVPCCLGGELRLFRLDCWAELAPRTLGILEPSDELIARMDRRVNASQVDLFVVPGVAFDRHGGRLGFGKGYYDRLLGESRTSSHKMGLAFDCQILEEVPMGPHDVFMDAVVTETSVYDRSRG